MLQAAEMLFYVMCTILYSAPHNTVPAIIGVGFYVEAQSTSSLKNIITLNHIIFKPFTVSNVLWSEVK